MLIEVIINNLESFILWILEKFPRFEFTLPSVDFLAYPIGVLLKYTDGEFFTFVSVLVSVIGLALTAQALKMIIRYAK